MTNYKVILDEQKLVEFIDWLPELKPNEKYYLSLLARNKYLEDRKKLKADKISLHRFTSDKKFMLRKVRKLEVPLGVYTQDDTPIPQEALALYISVNPRDLEKATKNALIKFAQVITTPYNGYDPQALVLSEIQKSTGTKHYLDFDFDNQYPANLRSEIEKHVNPEAVTYLNTRGGFHLLLNLKKLNKDYVKSYYKNLTNLPGCDAVGDSLIPVPGCTQGGFCPYFSCGV